MQRFFQLTLARPAMPLSSVPFASETIASRRCGIQETAMFTVTGANHDVWHIIVMGFNLVLLLFCGWALLSTMAATLALA